MGLFKTHACTACKRGMYRERGRTLDTVIASYLFIIQRSKRESYPDIHIKDRPCIASLEYREHLYIP